MKRHTVEIDILADDLAHAYVEGVIGQDGTSRAMIHVVRHEHATVWLATINATDEYVAQARSLRELARKLARYGKHDPLTATIHIDDERR